MSWMVFWNCAECQECITFLGACLTEGPQTGLKAGRNVHIRTSWSSAKENTDNLQPRKSIRHQNTLVVNWLRTSLQRGSWRYCWKIWSMWPGSKEVQEHLECIIKSTTTRLGDAFFPPQPCWDTPGSSCSGFPSPGQTWTPSPSPSHKDS